MCWGVFGGPQEGGELGVSPGSVCFPGNWGRRSASELVVRLGVGFGGAQGG